MITRETVQDFFNDLKVKGDFNISEKLLWGYFFLDSNKENLKKVADILQEKGYSFIDIFPAENDNSNELREYYLHLEKQEYHNIESLLKRNDEMYTVANLYKITYDGFDVGNIS